MAETNLIELLKATLSMADLSPEEASKFFGYTGRQIRRWIDGETQLGPKQIEVIKQGIGKIGEKIDKLSEGGKRAIWMGDVMEALFDKEELSKIEEEREKKKDQEKQFNEKVGSFIIELLNKANKSEREMFLDTDKLMDFQEIIWLAKKYGVKFPQGIL